MRVERNQSPLAILTIELPWDRAETRDFDFLGGLLVRRLRITDTIGFLSERRVGVLLPDTPKSGAWKVADDICSAYPQGHDRPSCDVIAYPDEALLRRDGAPQKEHETAESRMPAAIDSRIAEPTLAWKRTIEAIRAVLSRPAWASWMQVFVQSLPHELDVWLKNAAIDTIASWSQLTRAVAPY